MTKNKLLEWLRFTDDRRSELLFENIALKQEIKELKERVKELEFKVHSRTDTMNRSMSLLHHMDKEYEKIQERNRGWREYRN